MQLEGIRVVDLSRVLAGPFCSMFLADMGAEVIKIEDPRHGDPLREQGEKRNGLSLYFATYNRNKRSITLSLRSEQGKEVLRRLVASADVVLDNFRPGVMEAMGLGRDALQRLKPGLVSCHITGFGLDGPYAERPAFDFIAQAMSGFMSVNGEEGGPPMRAAPPLSDLVAGAYAAMGVLAALVRRSRSGHGEEVAASLTDSMISMLGFFATNYFANGCRPARTGNDHALVAPYGLFEASDGRVAIAPSSDAIYGKLLSVLGLEHLRASPEYRTNEDRAARREAINAEINRRTRLQTMEHWIALLNAAGVPCGRVLGIDEVFDDPQVRHQRMRLTVEHPQRGAIDVLGFPIKFTDEPCRLRRPPPELGADTEAILKNLGYAEPAIMELRREKVIQ
jgi:crotonobetainyl-CoA:carnitine CoA-transferase CaiB-like acyl-CoA transferase